MRLVLGILMLSALFACTGAHPAFMGVEPKTVQVDGSTFKIRIRENHAQATRTNFERIPKIGEIFPKAEKAIEQVSGCRVIPDSMRGDPAMMFAKLDCAL